MPLVTCGARRFEQRMTKLALQNAPTGIAVAIWISLSYGALAAQQPARQLPPGRMTFFIDLETSGGFTGSLRGSVTLASDGSVSAARVLAGNRDTDCRSQLATEDLRLLQRAVAGARGQDWPASFAPPGDNGCCDRIKWTLRLQQREANDRERTSVTTWFDGNEERLPKELAVIRDVAMRAQTRSLANCGR